MSDSLDAIPAVTASVLNPSVFDRGGNLVLGSFKPGAGAAANDETDAISTMTVKGISNVLQDGSRFNVLKGEKQAPDYFLEGYIENYGPRARRKLRKDQAYLSLDGDVWLRATGEKIFLFQASVVIDLKTQDPKTAAYQLGEAIARSMGPKE